MGFILRELTSTAGMNGMSVMKYYGRFIYQPNYNLYYTINPNPSRKAWYRDVIAEYEKNVYRLNIKFKNALETWRKHGFTHVPKNNKEIRY